MDAARKLSFLEPDPMLKPTLIGISIAYALLVVITAVEIAAGWRMEVAWTALMDSSDFVDWPPLSGLRLLGLGCIVSLCAASASVYHFHSVCNWTRRQDIISVVAATFVLVLAAAGFVGAVVVNCPEADAATQLSDQVVAVASFNVAACNAWCVAASSKILAPVCGIQEVPKPSAAFESLAALAGNDLEPWCRRALGLQGRGLLVGNGTTHDYTDCSPFCRLKMRYVTCLSSGDWHVVHYALESARFPVGLELAIILICHCCRRVQLRKLMLTRNDQTESLVELAAESNTV